MKEVFDFKPIRQWRDEDNWK